MPQTTGIGGLKPNDRTKKANRRGSSTPMTSNSSSASRPVRCGTKSSTRSSLPASCSHSKPAALQSPSHPQKSIKILLCTANLGNAQPDEASWDAWIPKLGQCSEVLENAEDVQMDPPPMQRRRPSSSVTSRQQQQQRPSDQLNPSPPLSGSSPRKPQPQTDREQEIGRRPNAFRKGSSTASSDSNCDEEINDSLGLTRKSSSVAYQEWLQTNCAGAPTGESNPDVTVSVTIDQEIEDSTQASMLTRKSSIVDYQRWLAQQGQQHHHEIGEGDGFIKNFPSGQGNEIIDGDNKHVVEAGADASSGEDDDYETFLKSLAVTQDEAAAVDDYNVEEVALGGHGEQPDEDGSYEAWLASQEKIALSIPDENGEFGGVEEDPDNLILAAKSDGTARIDENQIFGCSHEFEEHDGGSSGIASFAEHVGRGLGPITRDNIRPCDKDQEASHSMLLKRTSFTELANRMRHPPADGRREKDTYKTDVEYNTPENRLGFIPFEASFGDDDRRNTSEKREDVSCGFQPSQQVERLSSFSDLARQRNGFTNDSFDSVDANMPGRNGKTIDRVPSVSFETTFEEEPKIINSGQSWPSGLPIVSVDDGKKAEPIPNASKSDSRASQLSRSAPQEFFDVIVIGMQEATFEIEVRGSKEDQVSENSKGTRWPKDEADDDASKSDSGDDDEDDNEDDDDAEIPFLLETMNSEISAASSLLNSTTASSFEEDEEEEKQGHKSSHLKQASREGRNSLSSSSAILTKASATAGKKLLGATMKAGKVGFRVGKAGIRAGQKVTKATRDTAKTVNTLATAKNHTARPLPSDKVDGKGIEGQDADEDPETRVYPPGWSDTDVLHYHLEKDQLPGYTRALSYQLGQMRLMVYFRPTTSTTLDVVTVKHQATGKAGLLANKGGIVAEVAVNKSTRLSFLTAHLEAHEGVKKYAARNSSLMDILMGTKSSITAPFGMNSSKTYYDASTSSHFAFAMGDLNYRTRVAGVQSGSDRHIKMVHSMTRAQDWRILNKFDELAYALRMKECLVGFETPYCNFSPTFKVARKEGYEYNVKRSPSYTDRILFRSGDQLGSRIRPLMYEPVEKFTTSDHKPMRGAFSVQLNEPLKWGAAAPLPELDDAKNSKSGLKDVDVMAFQFFGQKFEKRETMHVVVSAIQCFIHPEEYDKLRKVDKADLPNPFVCFVSTPTQAVHLDDDTSKKGLWSKLASFGSKKKNIKEDGRSRNSTNGTGKTFPASVTRLSDRYPCTSIIEETMKPNWMKENLHFTIRTHMSNGVPIDLSGALLHVTLMDAKGPTVIGSFALNLFELIMKSRRPSKGGLKKPQRPMTSARKGTSKTTSGNGTNPAQQSGLLSPSGRKSRISSSRAGNSTVSVQEKARVGIPSTPRAFITGPSMSLRNLVVDEPNAPKDGKRSEMLRKFQITSLRLDDSLLDCGLEVGKIKCSFDVWWADEESLIGEDDS